jgi:hypothetical protein
MPLCTYMLTNRARKHTRIHVRDMHAGNQSTRQLSHAHASCTGARRAAVHRWACVRACTCVRACVRAPLLVARSLQSAGSRPRAVLSAASLKRGRTEGHVGVLTESGEARDYPRGHSTVPRSTGRQARARALRCAACEGSPNRLWRVRVGFKPVAGWEGRWGGDTPRAAHTRIGAAGAVVGSESLDCTAMQCACALLPHAAGECSGPGAVAPVAWHGQATAARRWHP